MSQNDNGNNPTNAATPENVRPWGRYDVIDAGEGFKVKRITVKPGQRLSYQSHRHRSEYWTIVSGSARITVDDSLLDRKRGGTVTITVGAKHRVENPGSEPLVFIEVQIGEYLGEDDIERFDDDYGRA